MIRAAVSFKDVNVSKNG